MKYWVQTKSEAGSWIDSLGTDDRKGAESFAEYQAKDHRVEARVVERTDKVVLTVAVSKGVQHSRPHSKVWDSPEYQARSKQAYTTTTVKPKVRI